MLFASHSDLSSISRPGGERLRILEGALFVTLLLALASAAAAFEDSAHSYCSTTTAQTCNVDGDCPGGETCMSALGCADGVDNDGDGFTDTQCSVTTTTSCTVDTDCPGGETCDADPDCLVEMFCQDGVDNDGDGDTDGADPDCQCLDDVFNAGNCTANDVSFVTIGLGIQDDGCVSTNDTVTIYLGAELETTAVTRYDIGMWVDLGGGNARGDNPAGTPGTCARMILQPTAAPPNQDPFFPGSCSVNTSTACDFHTDCPLFNLDGDPPGEICEVDAFRLEDTDKCGEISKNDSDPGGGTEHANFIWPFPVTLPCTSNPTPDGFVALGRCSTWAQNANGIACQSVADAGPETTSKCRCDETDAGLVTNIPLPEVSTSCACDSPTTVPPGFPVTCTVSYSNAASCTVDAGTPERFQCGTAGYLRMDLDDGAASGTLSGICIDTGHCSVTTATACTVDADCPVSETCVSRGQCSVTTTTSCSSFADCPGGEKCVLPTCDVDADCPNSGTCSVDGDLGTVETVGGNCSTTTTTECTVDADCPGGETCEIAGGLHWTPQSSAGPSLGIVGPGDAGSLDFVYTVDSGAGDGTINVTFTPKWVNGGSCSTTTTTSCQSDADCPGGETCVPDFTANAQEQTVIQSTCSLNVDATHVLVPSFRALDAGGQVVLEWETTSEVGTLGFDVLRWDDAQGAWVKVNETLVPALQNVPGGTYRMADPGAAPSAGTLSYKLVEVDVHGIHRASAPYRVEIAPDPKAGGADMPYEATPREPTDWMLARLAAAKAAPPQAGPKKAGSGGRAKIATEEPGIYFLAVEEIAAALDQPEAKTRSDLRSGRLRLSNRGADVAWQAAGDGSGIFFYGEAVDSQFARDNVYWLERDQGVQMTVVNGPVPAPAPQPQSFAASVHREEDLLGRPAVALDPLDDYWFWDGILTGVPPHEKKSFTFDLDGVASTSGNATLAVTLYGFTNPLLSVEHRAAIRVNGGAVGEVGVLGKGSRSSTVSFPQSLLQEGSNTVEVVGLAGDFFVDSFDVGYRRSYRASADRLVLRGDGNAVVTVSGLSEGDVRVYEISDPWAPRVVAATSVDVGGDGTYRVSFVPASPDATYFVTAAGAVKSATAVGRGDTSYLRDGRTRAEYIVLAPAPLMAAAEDLADYRRSTGLTALAIDVEDVFDEFNDGVSDPRALRELLSYAYRSWREPPRYAVLAGKGSYDYRDLLGMGGNLIPPLMASTADGLVAADNAYGDVAGDDGLPEIAVGRLPVLTATELEAYVAKISAYESASGAWTRQVTMVADDADGAGDFAADSDALAALLPPGLDVEAIQLGHPYTAPEARQRLREAIREGAVLLSYVGHGGPDRMATEGLLTTADVPSLDNGERLPVVTAMTCNLGMFAVPGLTSLGETLVLHGDGGAAALWGPMGLSQNQQAVGLGDHLIEALFAADDPRLGDALRRALAGFVSSGGDREMLKIYGLLGDPALGMK